jgi:hypothetical protein
MFKNAQELKNFILWCKSEKVKAFKNDNIQFEMSDLAFVEHLDEPGDILKEANIPAADTFAEMDPESGKEDDDLMYWSST